VKRFRHGREEVIFCQGENRVALMVSGPAARQLELGPKVYQWCDFDAKARKRSRSPEEACTKCRLRPSLALLCSHRFF
jgi:hypothetical protein